MRRRACPAARSILAQLGVDKAQRRYDRTRSHNAYADLRAKQLACLKLQRRSPADGAMPPRDRSGPNNKSEIMKASIAR